MYPPRPMKDFDRLSSLYAARVATHDLLRPGYKLAWDALSAAILSRGGQLVVPPTEPEPQIDDMVDNLADWPADPVVLRRGTNNACHANSANAWCRGEVESMATGYALSNDDLWRQHTWAITAAGVIVESTGARLAYVGVPLAGVDALRFAFANADQGTLEATLRSGGPITALALANPPPPQQLVRH